MQQLHQCQQATQLLPQLLVNTAIGCWSLTSLFSTNTAISETKGRGGDWRVILSPSEGRLVIGKANDKRKKRKKEKREQKMRK